MQDLERTTGLLRMACQADARASFFPSWDREVNRRDAVVELPEGEMEIGTRRAGERRKSHCSYHREGCLLSDGLYPNFSSPA